MIARFRGAAVAPRPGRPRRAGRWGSVPYRRPYISTLNVPATACGRPPAGLGLVGDAVDRTGRPPDVAADHPDPRTVVVGHLGHVGRLRLLVAGRRHLERRRLASLDLCLRNAAVGLARGRAPDDVLLGRLAGSSGQPRPVAPASGRHRHLAMSVLLGAAVAVVPALRAARAGIEQRLRQGAVAEAFGVAPTPPSGRVWCLG